MKKIILLIVIITCIMGLNKTTKAQTTTPCLIPIPTEIKMGTGNFVFDATSEIDYDIKDIDLKKAIESFVVNFRKVTSLPLADNKMNPKAKTSISVIIDKRANQLGEEGYYLDVKKNNITIKASNYAGIFYGFQTLRQLLPKEIESKAKVSPKVNWEVPCLNITDKPRFLWRGMLLDCGRHFMDKDFVKRYIDLLSYYKMNRLHWHLTEDQGWRIEIKKYPKLTEIGSWRTEADGKRYGGFYTQADIKEVVAYAAEHFVTVIPEIEMPGHSVGAIASYPFLSCTGLPIEVEHNWGVFKDIYCAGNDSTFSFIQDVLDEVITLFPAKYIHIGGDEAPKYRWENCPKCQARIKKEGLKDEAELQSYFIKRIEAYLKTKNRSIIGWDEILEGGLAPAATVQSWRGVQGGINAATTGHDAIMSPTSHAYFDYDVKALDLQKVYSFEPIPQGLTEEQSKHILGGECNMWTERGPQDQVDNRMFPRMLAMTEALWSLPQNKNYDAFYNRVQKHYSVLDKMGVTYGYEAQPIVFKSTFDKVSNTFAVTFIPGQPNLKFYYTTDGSIPTQNSNNYTKPIVFSKSGSMKAAAFLNGKQIGDVFERNFIVSKALGKKVTSLNPYNKEYEANGELTLTDGIKGTLEHNDKIWQGYHKIDVEAIIDLEKSTTINKVTVGFLQNVPAWIFMPEFIEFYVSDDNITFKLIETIKNNVSQNDNNSIIKDYICTPKESIKARYIKVHAKNIAKCPSWHPGAGGDTWLFIDEISVE